jgi:hypothetical protein
MSSIQLLMQKEDLLISEFQDKILSMKQTMISDNEQNINKEKSTTVYVPKRRNKKTINTENPTEDDLKNIAKQYSDIEIGSYPFFDPPNIGTDIVLKGNNEEKLQEALEKIINLVNCN